MMSVVKKAKCIDKVHDPINIRKIDEADFPKDILSEQIMFILQYAILAPSTHNIQPWLFKVNNNVCEIYFDKDLLLPKADKTGRDLYISLGCLLENLLIAARYFGIYDRVEYMLKGNHVLNVYFKPGIKDESLKDLLQAILTRINVRGIFDQKVIEREKLDHLKNIDFPQGIRMYLLSKKDEIKEVGKLTSLGIRQAYKDRDFRKEMFKVINPNFSKKKQGLPGYSLRMPMLISIIFPWVVRFFNIGKILARLNSMSIYSAGAACIFASEKDDPEHWLKVGQAAERFMLEAVVLGLRSSIFVASVEVGSFYKRVQRLLGIKLRPQFLLCLGYMDLQQKYTPRQELNKKLIY